MEIGAEQFSHYIAVRRVQIKVVNGPYSPTYISSSGEMKMSLKLMTCKFSATPFFCHFLCQSYILMLKMLQELQLSIRPLRQDRRAERFHNLLHRHRLSGELILGRAVFAASDSPLEEFDDLVAHQTSPKAPIPTGCRSVYLAAISLFASAYTISELLSHLLVISNVVPKICARTNSAFPSVSI